jgi:transcriptional regulator with XRE-family HTH domain
MNGKDLRGVLSQNIKFFRHCRGFSQAELAEKANLSIPFLSQIEQGNKWPLSDSFTKIAEALNVEVWELFKTDKNTEDNIKFVLHLKSDVKNRFSKMVDELFKNYESAG